MLFNSRSKRSKCCNLKSICMIFMLLAGADLKFADAGMADGLTEGLKYAGQMFGINTAADVADLVAKAFSNAATNTAQTKPDFFSTLFQRRQKPIMFPENEDDSQAESQQQATHKKGAQKTQENSNEKYNDDSKPNGSLDFSSAALLTSILRMIGFDARKLGALALNAMVMMAQAVGNTLLGAFTKKPSLKSSNDSPGSFMNSNNAPLTETKEESSQENTEYRPRELRSGSPIDWFLQNPSDEMKGLLSHAMNTKLADDLADMIGNVEKTIPNGENSGSCIKMLVCKCSPFIWGMQRSLEKRINKNDQEKESDQNNNNNSLLDTSVFYKDLPSLKEFREHSAICDQRYGDYCKTKDYGRA